MNEERRGGEWKINDRVVYTHRDPKRQDRVLGTIVDRSWGRDSKSLPIWRLRVIADGETESWPADPEHLQAAPEELIAEISQAGEVHSLVDEVEPAPDIPVDPHVFPESPPDQAEFGPMYASEMREYRKRKRRWDREQEQAASQENPEG